jgi:RHS repeat-associated protein
LYGNLTGKEEVSLDVSPEGTLLNPDEEQCHIKTFGYSSDGFNLLTTIGDCKGNQTVYTYQSGTNLLIKKFIFDRRFLKKRTFKSYNEDAVCIKITDDDGTEQVDSRFYGGAFKEQHITKIYPKETLPGVGLPEIIEEKAFDVKSNQEVLLKKLINTYDNQSNLISCSTFDANEQYVFTERRAYNPLGQVVSLIDAAGREVNYAYDHIGNRIAASWPCENKNVATIYDFHNQPTEITESTADAQFTVSNSYDSLGRKICSKDRFGNITQYEYDAFDRLTKVSHPLVLDENNQVICPTFSYTYDLFGNALTVEDSKGFITSKTYNLRGDPTKISYPDGTFELFKYDPEGSLHRSLNRDKIVTIYEYDYLGRPVYEEKSVAEETGAFYYHSSQSRQYDGFRCTGTHMEKFDCFKLYAFDLAGRVSSIIEPAYGNSGYDPDIRKTEIAYDPLGRAHQKKVWFGSGSKDYTLECFKYDVPGNILEKRIEDAEGNILLRRGFSYNLIGQCTEEFSLENGSKTTLVKTYYNSEGEPIGYVDGCNQETKVIIDNAYQNALGQTVLKKTLVNPIGVQTEIEFDALSRVYAITKIDSFGILLSSQKTLYDALGNKAFEIYDRIVDGKIIDSQKTRRIYGPMGRLEEEVQIADSALEKRTRYSYNSLGQMTSKLLVESGSLIKYSYNKEGFLYKVEANENEKELQISNTYTYDRRGNILSANSIDGKSVRRCYNALNELTKETINDGEGVYSLQYAYDRKGRIKQVTLPDNSKILYRYDAVFGREVQRLSADGKVLYSHIYEHFDEQGQLLCEKPVGCLGTNTYSYDLTGRKIEINGEIYSQKYIRDPLGRLLETRGKNREKYGYNALSQLVSEQKDIIKTYAYDSLDNRIKSDTEVLKYDALNQLTSQSQAKYSYDPQGNLLKKVLDGEETQFVNNALSQLISIEKADNTTLNFSYDPFGRILIEKHLDSKGNNRKTLSTTRYFYIGLLEIGTLTASGKIQALKIPGLQENELSMSGIAFEINGETYVPIHDIAGNVINLVEPQSGQLVESYQYGAFGEETIYNANGDIEEASIVGNPWRFAGKRIDQKSGLILFGLRFYDPSIGRWISQDPAGFIDGPNLYAYLHNNPLNCLDRFGLQTESTSNIFETYFYGTFESRCFCVNHRTCKRGGDIGTTIGFHLPKITYDDSFEIINKDVYRGEQLLENYYEGSKGYDLSELGLPDLPDMEIGIINGINNSFKEARSCAKYISRLAGGCNIHAVYNATHGIKVDLRECDMGLRYIATEPVRQLHKMWNGFFEKSSANSKFMMICHSQGAIHVRNALLDYPPELRDRILVVAIAPGGYIYEETCAKVVHYRANWYRDPIPRLDRYGVWRSKGTVVDLDSHSNAPYFDHAFKSPTYQKRLKQHIETYIESRGRIL